MKILLTGNIFYNYEDSIRKALLKNGHEVNCIFNNIEGPFFPGNQTSKWLKFGFLPQKLNMKYFLQKEVSAYNEKLLSVIDTNSFDLLLVVKGLTIEQRVLEKFQGPKILWILDSIGRFPGLKDTIQSYDHVFSFESSDVKYNEIFHSSIKYLPVAFDPDYYQPLNLDFERDWSFVGARKPNREVMLGKMLENGIDDIMIVGDYHRVNNEKLRKKTYARVLEHQKINQIYNTSRINLNIHKAQSVESGNPRFYEILGSGGGIQFVEPQKAIFDHFTDGEHLVYYQDIEELESKSGYYLNNPELIEKISRNALEVALKYHTWEQRVREITDLYE